MKKSSKTIYLCQSCGNDFIKWSGRCESCGEWNTLTEIKDVNITSNNRQTKQLELGIKNLSQIKIDNKLRMLSGIGEFDRVLGGGIVKGSLILVGGEPGIGKSTLILQLAKSINNICYISAEESLEQIKLRAQRIGVNSSSLKLISSGDLELIEREIRKINPSLIVVDSIQTVYLNSYPSTPGSLVQVRESGMFIQRLAKSTNIPAIIIGHVTKEGNIAGPRMLEHLVDVVLYLEGERFHDARVLAGLKNRYGATDETGIFTHTDKGLAEVKNPSELFLSHKKSAEGSATSVIIKGTRPMLVEIQALTLPTKFGYPKRTAAGFDLNRLNLLAAVLTRNTKINLSNYDIYLKVTGGLRIVEPAVDLAVVASIMSSYFSKPIIKKIAFFGEVGLSGEIRRVIREKERLKESKKLGFDVIGSDMENIKDIIKLFKTPNR